MGYLHAPDLFVDFEKPYCKAMSGPTVGQENLQNMGEHWKHNHIVWTNC